ncbi:MAG: ABC transporter permease, partial [Pyrinomonadaceae bacterium]
MKTLLQDLRYGIRMLLKNKGFTLVAVLTLALGIGANTAIFSVVNAVMLRPLPYPQPERLMVVGRSFSDEVGYTGELEFLFIHEHQQSFESLALYQPIFSGVNLAGGNEVEYVEGMRVSLDFFRTVGIQPAIGRSFTPEEDVEGGEHVAILSADLWKRRFGADASLIGKTILINGQNHTVVGVMPQGFEFLPDADVFIPLRPSLQGDPNPNYLIIARLKQNVTLGQARADLKLLAEKYRAANPGQMEKNESLTAQPVQEFLSTDVRGLLWILLTAVGFVLLIACANVANLQLTRAVDRHKEIAVRLALGASVRSIVMLLLTEGVLLALLGGFGGLLLAWWGIDYLKAFIPEETIPLVGQIMLDWRVLVFTFVAAILTGVIFGLAPANQILKVDLNHTLKEGASKGAGGAVHGRLRSVLVVTEIALSLVLLIGAALLIRTFVNLRHIEPGFDPHHVLTFQVTPMGPQYEAGNQARDFYRRALERISGLPSVEVAAVTNSLPLSGQFNMPFVIAGRLEIPEAVQFRVVSPDYFKVMKMVVRQGRAFAEIDALGSEPVVIANEAFVHRYLTGADPLKQRISIGLKVDLPRQLVGVTSDTKQFGLGLA